MKILYVPEAIRVALTGADRTPGFYLKLDSLADTLSAEDVALYIYCNMAIRELVPADIVESFDSLELETMLEAAPAESAFISDIKNYLANFKAHNLDFSTRLAPGLLMSDLLDDEIIRFSHFSEMAKDNDVNNLQPLYERVVQQMYSFTPFEKLAALPVMAGLLTYMQKKAA